MSEAQLKKILQENESLKTQLERMPKVIKTSEACKEFQSYCQKTPEPFLQDFGQPNPWHTSPGGGICTIL